MKDKADPVFFGHDSQHLDRIPHQQDGVDLGILLLNRLA